MQIELEELSREVKFKTSRSSGAGGQNVNKVETKVSLLWAVAHSVLLNDEQKQKLTAKLANRTNADGLIQIDVSETRSQLQNKEIALKKLSELIHEGLKPTKKRLPTKIPRTVVLDRLDRKKRQAKKKADRRWRMD